MNVIDITCGGGVAAVRLSNGMSAIVNLEDVPLVCKYHWTAVQSRGKWYASSRLWVSKTVRPVVFMHRLVNNTPDGMDTDHINSNGLDNTRENLRSCTRAENAHYAKVKRSTRYKGVIKRKTGFHIRLTVKGARFHLGGFKTEYAAARAYDLITSLIYGEAAENNGTFASQQKERLEIIPAKSLN